MRTTLTIDDELAVKLKDRARERGLPFKQVVNEAIREGLSGGGGWTRRYTVPDLPLRARPDAELDKALQLAGALEDAELIRKRTLGR